VHEIDEDEEWELASVQTMSYLKFQSFVSVKACTVCGFRSCTNYGRCDTHEQVDRAIITCANVCNYATPNTCVESASFQGMTPEQVYLAYRAGEVLAGKVG
jgi:hypothetical protein